MRPSIRRTAAWSAAFVVVAGGMLVLMYSLQRSLIYYPDSSPVPSANAVIPGAADLTLRTEDGLELTAWHLPQPDPDAWALLYAPGNGGNRLARADIAAQFAEAGFAVLVMEYRGYGGNPGSPDEQGLAKDARAAAAALRELGHPPERTLYVGESLGTGVVAALAVTDPPAGIVLRSPFPELADVAAHHYGFLPVRRLLKDRYPTTEHLASAGVPVTVVRGDADTVIPTELSARVAAEAPDLVEDVLLGGVGHNDPPMFGAPLVEATQRLRDELSRRG
ncbi:alpha/beta hydrolase [Nocardioides limicola]|uniref:alpha/beta hydrolase n=1 Tax=Nocardioides limicola TaxID=2803368 RepID=UPI00193C6956|nr:alpha/beta hydrolase [Nocardioides sp. DJM-14]